MYAVDRWGPFAQRIGSSAAEAGQASLAFLCRQLSKLGGMKAMCRERLVPLQYVHNILKSTYTSGSSTKAIPCRVVLIF
jgi:hypothetical protein